MERTRVEIPGRRIGDDAPIVHNDGWPCLPFAGTEDRAAL